MKRELALARGEVVTRSELLRAGWIKLMQGQTDEAVVWMQLALDKRISQVLTARAFAQILPQSPLGDVNFQRFLQQMRLHDVSLSAHLEAEQTEFE